MSFLKWQFIVDFFQIELFGWRWGFFCADVCVFSNRSLITFWTWLFIATKSTVFNCWSTFWSFFILNFYVIFWWWRTHFLFVKWRCKLVWNQFLVISCVFSWHHVVILGKSQSAPYCWFLFNWLFFCDNNWLLRYFLLRIENRTSSLRFLILYQKWIFGLN